MRHPLLAKAKAFQPADDNRPFEEFMMEQVALPKRSAGKRHWKRFSEKPTKMKISLPVPRH